MTVWLIGANGMLGRELAGLMDKECVSYTPTDLELDITDKSALFAFAGDLNPPPGFIVNCSAYTAVDKAEDEPDKAKAVNVEGVRNIAETAERLGARLIHISTDYVFDGAARSPYTEDAPVNPIGVYAKTKEAGERAIRDVLPEHYIIRTSWLYGRHGNNFVYTMLRLMKERDSIGVVADQKGGPTWAKDLSSAIIRIIKSGTETWGTYHYSNDGETTWYDFAREIHRLVREIGILDKDCAINPLTADQYPTKAKRPAYSVFSKEKIRKTFGVEVPRWATSLNEFLSEYSLELQEKGIKTT